MANPAPLGFGDGPEPDATPKDQPPKDQPPKEQSAKKRSKKTPAGDAPTKPVVICQRCKVACERIPQSRGWVRCPKCRWKHKTFDGLQAAKQALRGKQSRAAR